MAPKRRARKITGLFDVPDRRHDGDDGADSGDSVGVFGGPTHDSGLFGGPRHSSGLFDAPERSQGDMPGLFDRPGRATGSPSDLPTEPPDGGERSVGLFDKPRRSRR